jgi:ankyrin repeat protein
MKKMTLFLFASFILSLSLNSSLHAQPGPEDKRNLDKNSSDLIDACIKGDLENVKRLVEDNNVSVNIQTISGKTPLICATIMEHTDVVRYLIVEKNADTDCSDSNGFTALYYAQVYEFKDIIKILEDN